MPLPLLTRPSSPPRSSQAKTFSACAPSTNSTFNGRRLCITNGSVSGHTVTATVGGTVIGGGGGGVPVYPAEGPITIKGPDRKGRLLFSWTIRAVPQKVGARTWVSSPQSYTITTPGVVSMVTMKFGFM